MTPPDRAGGGSSGTDPYIDPGTGVLRNRLGISNPDQLEAAETDFTAVRLAGLLQRPLPATTTWRTCDASTSVSSATSTPGPGSCARW